MFHDAFVAPTMDANRNGGPLLDTQVTTTSGVTNGPCDVGTTIQIEEALAHDVHQACAILDDVATKPQTMEEQGYGPHRGNVKCQFENMECDQIRQAGIDDTSNMHGRQDGMGDGPCKGGDTRIPSVFDLSEACCPLYTRARCSKLSTTLILLNICTTHGCSNKFLDELLSLLHKFIPHVDNCLPPTMYHAKSLTRKLGMDCNIIHACKMGCILYRGVYGDLQECPKNGSLKYKQVGCTQVPTKKLHHFSIIPRLIRFYRSPAISKLLVWHHENKSTDGPVRHVADSKAWMHIDNNWPDFAADLKNIRFGLATVGFNSFSDKTCIWSTWPVMLLVYNLPPWMATKRFFMLLALLIPGKEQVKSENIDVYLQPLTMNSKNYGNPVFQHGIYQNNLMTNCSTYGQWSYGPFMII
jgi:hypothetical protein